ncbi:hypothetical protein P9112_004039 [Eukaryota sp. TZLM1-RC]
MHSTAYPYPVAENRVLSNCSSAACSSELPSHISHSKLSCTCCTSQHTCRCDAEESHRCGISLNSIKRPSLGVSVKPLNELHQLDRRIARATSVASRPPSFADILPPPAFASYDLLNDAVPCTSTAVAGIPSANVLDLPLSSAMKEFL